MVLFNAGESCPTGMGKEDVQKVDFITNSGSSASRILSYASSRIFTSVPT